MQQNKPSLDPVERSLLELTDVEQSGLFHRTPVEAAALLAAGRATPAAGPTWYRSWRMWTPLAAAAMLAFAIGATMFQSQLNEIRRARSAMTNQQPDRTSAGCNGNFLKCFNGPLGPALAGACKTYDYDADGDVDLADFHSFQVGCQRAIASP